MNDKCIISVHLFEVVCTPSLMSLKVISSFYEKKYIHLDDLHLADFSCLGNQSMTSHEHWEFKIEDLASCSTAVSVYILFHIFQNRFYVVFFFFTSNCFIY